MKAATYTAYGHPKTLVMADIATTTPKDGEALVRVNYAGINPIDWKIGEGRLKAYIDCSFPLVVGRDISGVIVDKNNNDRFNVGDQVVAALPGPGGGLAEYVAVPVDYLALAPQKMPLKESASIPLVGLTCWQGLIEYAELSEGQVIFILSGAGGTGSFAIQLAKSVGATVITTCRPANLEYVKKLGADIVFDYEQPDVMQEIRALFPDGIDLIFSNVLGDLHEKSYSVLRKGGKLVTIGEPLIPGLGKRYGIKELDFVIKPDGDQLANVIKLVDSGKIRTPEITTFPFNRCGEALSKNMEGHTKGKIIVEVAP